MGTRASRQKYISPQEVEHLILRERANPSYLIIDVRSSDFPGGNLPGAVNITTDKFRNDEAVKRVIATEIEPRLPQLKTVIVHCMRSQTRGPYVAHLLSASPALPRDVSVEILEGGFQGWWRRYRGRKELFEGLSDQETRDAAGVQGGTDQEWEDVVEADEGSAHEADDSRRLRQSSGI